MTRKYWIERSALTSCLFANALEGIKLSDDDGTCNSFFFAQHVTSQKQIQFHKATVCFDKVIELCFFMFFFSWKCSATYQLIKYVGNALRVMLKKFNKIQQYEDIYLMLNYSTSFGRPSCPLTRVHKAVVAACGTNHNVKWKSSTFLL